MLSEQEMLQIEMGEINCTYDTPNFYLFSKYKARQHRNICISNSGILARESLEKQIFDGGGGWGTRWAFTPLPVHLLPTFSSKT